MITNFVSIPGIGASLEFGLHIHDKIIALRVRKDGKLYAYTAQGRKFVSTNVNPKYLDMVEITDEQR